MNLPKATYINDSSSSRVGHEKNYAPASIARLLGSMYVFLRIHAFTGLVQLTFRETIQAAFNTIYFSAKFSDTTLRFPCSVCCLPEQKLRCYNRDGPAP
jgi:hypothetical protein